MADVIRIGVFFDGTGNNMWNDLAIGDKSETNVAKIYQMYAKQAEINSGYATPLYVEGVGTEGYTKAHTFVGEIDKDTGKDKIEEIKHGKSCNDFYSSWNMAFGDEAKSKVNRMLQDIAAVIRDNAGKEIIVDVYGFSRGATETRDFINEFNALYADLDGSAIGFVGLFDTVSSLGFANSTNIGFNLNLNDNSASQIVQIDAANEMRSNFPLESLGNGTNRVEISMIGAHADIGGGYGNLSADTKEFIIIGNPINEMFTPIAIAETAIKERDDRIVILLQQAKDQSAQTGKHITFEYNKYLTYDRNGNLELRGVFVEERDVGFGLSNNALHTMYDYMSTQGISLNLSGYPMVPDSSDYVHTSSMNRVFDRTGLTEWLANREEWSPIDSRRDSHPNYPLEAETKLLLLSAEDKTILHYLEADKYTILGTEKEFDDITKNIVQNAPEFMIHRLEYINQYLSDNPDTSGTLYRDHYSGKEFYGEKINGISLVDFAASGDNILVYDENNEGQIVYAKEGEDLVYTGGGNDVLDGGAGSDTLLGGSGFDTYYSGDSDTIDDSDGKGEVNFEGFKLTGGTHTGTYGTFKTYDGDGGMYILRSDGTLIFSKNGNFLTINNYNQDAKSLGITLTDELPELTIIGNMANENDGVVTGKVVLTQAYGRDMIVHLSTLDDTAHAGEDYQSDNDITVTIAAGETEGDFSVNLIDDQIVEGRETLFTQIDSVTDTSNQPINYTIKDITPLTIEDDDGLNVSVFAPTVSENVGIATGAVTINKIYDKDLTLTLYTQDDSAVSGEDYVAKNAIRVTILAGSTYAEFNVDIVDDDKPEPTETFYALVQSVVDSSGTAVDYTLVDVQPFTIEDDDTGDDTFAHISISDPTLTEDNTMMRYDITLTSGPVDKDITIDLQTINGSATSGNDYMGSQGAITIKAGETSAYYNVMIFKDDDTDEGSENFYLAPTNYTIADNLDSDGNEKIKVFFDNAGMGTIEDNGQIATPYDDVLILTDDKFRANFPLKSPNHTYSKPRIVA
jgi:hypothetical protein